MATPTSKLFNFSRPLPPPFDKITRKKIAVSSKYGDGTNSTLCASSIKAVNAYCKCLSTTEGGALGFVDTKIVAEYKSSDSSDAYHLVVYDPTTGAILASVYDKSTELVESYTVGNSARDGSAILMAMLPEFMKDDEFREHLDAYQNEYRLGFPDMNTAKNTMAVLCDNMYRRVVDETCAANVKARIEGSGNLMRISQTQLDSGNFEPKTVLAGEFSIFAHGAGVTILAPTASIDHADFIGKYALNESRLLSPLEQALVPKLDTWYILPPEVVSICSHAKATTGKAAAMRNFLLRGPAGTGKTMGAQAIAAGLNLPYMKYTCSANTEVFDFVGQVFPETDAGTTGDVLLDEERKQLREMGGFTYENVAKLMKLPDLDDMDYDPEGVYKALTGVDKPDATSQDCMAIVMQMVTDKVQKLSHVKHENGSGGQTYTYVETDFIRALKNGYVVEIQEPTVIMQPGVLVGLNSLLELSGSITLPTGEIIRRHPDAVVIVTTNLDYEGCRGVNQSVLDRMNLIQDIELPSPEVMAQRAMSVTGCEDDYLVSQMVQVVNDMATFCRRNGITDGSCGMRGLIDWIISTEITGDAYTSALYTVVSKATSDEEDRNAIITSVLEPIFAPRRSSAAV